MEERGSASFFAREVRAAMDFYRCRQKWPHHGNDRQCIVEESLWQIDKQGMQGMCEKLG